jgi:hypothetical protein
VLKLPTKKVKVKRLSKSLRSTFIIAPRLVDLGGALYTLIIVISGAF